MEKWQECLMLGQTSIKEQGQGVIAEVGVVDTTALAQAEEVAWRTRELLASKGWCLWKCSTLNSEVIAVVRDENVEGLPEAYPAYTEAELEELCQDDVSEATLRLVYEAKKLAGEYLNKG